jgi:hypothetical protein
MSYLMWEFKNVNVGRFHAAGTKDQRTAMIDKGYVDITKMNGLEIPYPTGYKAGGVTPEPKTPKTKAAA